MLNDYLLCCVVHWVGVTVCAQYINITVCMLCVWLKAATTTTSTISLVVHCIIYSTLAWYDMGMSIINLNNSSKVNWTK